MTTTSMLNHLWHVHSYNSNGEYVLRNELAIKYYVNGKWCEWVLLWMGSFVSIQIRSIYNVSQ